MFISSSQKCFSAIFAEEGVKSRKRNVAQLVGSEVRSNFENSSEADALCDTMAGRNVR